jgi:hypothetical protein
VDLFVVCLSSSDQNLYIARMKIVFIYKMFLSMWYLLNIISSSKRESFCHYTKPLTNYFYLSFLALMLYKLNGFDLPSSQDI